MRNAQNDIDTENKFRKDLGLISALSLVVGMVLGAGAFMKPAAVLGATGNYNYALLAWIIGGLFSICGGLTLCELGGMFPKTGGLFVYLEKIYGSKVAHLYGWAVSIIFGPAIIGALASYFSAVFCLLFAIPNEYTLVVSILVMGTITTINAISVKQAGYIQTITTLCKLIPIVMLIVFGLWKGNGEVHIFSASDSAMAATAPFAISILATLFAYDGWAQVASVAGEIKNPAKILPKAIIFGISFLILIYICINMAFFKIFSVKEMVEFGHDASSVASQKLFGKFGGNLLSVGIMVSILGGMNGYTMTLSRTVFSLAERGTMIGSKLLSTIDNDSRSPINSILFLMIISIFYSLCFDANALSDIAMFAIWFFYLLTFIGVIIGRKKYKHMQRDYKVPFYPVIPLIAIFGAIYVIYGMLTYHFVSGILSIMLTLAGLPVYYYFNKIKQYNPDALGNLKQYKFKMVYKIIIATLVLIALMLLMINFYMS